jgi:hypothetical protein
VHGCALELFGDRQVAFVLEWSLELVGSLSFDIADTSALSLFLVTSKGFLNGI